VRGDAALPVRSGLRNLYPAATGEASVSTAAERTDPPKPTFEAYWPWLIETVEHATLAVERSRFEAASSKALLDIERSEFWQQTIRGHREVDDAYFVATGYKLFASPEFPTLLPKSWDAFLLKTYRKNVLNNSVWPDAPQQGWVTPRNWYARINDIVRTLFVVKYLDGVEFLADTFNARSVVNDLECKCDFEAKDEGYYAAHTYVTINVDIPSATWDTELTPVQFEIQITTQLQEVIRRLTHAHYESRRATDDQERPRWQWNYRSAEFVPNYLGHIIHYVEGMIMEVRDSERTS
jgi:ppGpp synthetase/RelA/SpoT-type nucleotidyltranferase